MLFDNIPLSYLDDSIKLVPKDTLLHATTLAQKINVLDEFFIEKLCVNEAKVRKIEMLGKLCRSISKEPMFDIEKIAIQFGLSKRYIQKLFASSVGLSPRMFFNTNRFNKSIDLMRSSDPCLTPVAYACGYFDQSHFIKEFKKFTGIAPSQAQCDALIPRD